MDTDRDLAAVRELRAAQGEPTELALARVRRRVTTSMGGTGSTPVRLRRSWVPALGAAAAVLAVAGLVVAIQHSRAGSPQPAPPQQIGAATTPAPPSTSTPPSPATVDMSVTPVVLAPGQLLYVKTQTAGGAPPMESWEDPQGMITVQLEGTSSANLPVRETPESMADQIAFQRAQLTANGPSIKCPTPSYLAGLPTDPAALYALLKAQLAADMGKGPRPELIFADSIILFSMAEPLLPPAVRAAFLQALLLAPGAHADHTPRTIGGHSVYLIEQTYGPNVSAVVVDSSSGRIVGGYNSREDLVESEIYLWTFAVVSAPGQRP